MNTDFDLCKQQASLALFPARSLPVPTVYCSSVYCPYFPMVHLENCELPFFFLCAPVCQVTI